MKRSFVIYFLFFISTVGFVSCDHVPMVLWNLKGASVPLRPLAAFEANNDKYMQELLQSTLKDGSTNVLVFVGDKLSMEDLAPEPLNGESGIMLKSLQTLLGDESHIMLPSVKDPLKHFRDAACGVKDIHTGKHNSANLEKSIESAFEDSCVVIVHLGNKGLPTTDKKLSFKTSMKNVVGVFTASKSSWHPAEELHRRSRSLFAAETDVPHFINFTGCIIMYADNVTLLLGSLANETKTLQLPPTVDGKCDNYTSSLTLTFGKTDKNPEVILMMKFEKGVLSWNMLNSTVQVKGDKVSEIEFDLRASTVDVPLSFSYSCGKYSMIAVNSSIPITIGIDGFQIQPYDVQGPFASSFNCVSWFTLPIWMGVFISLLFIAILNSGVYMLFNIKTMDRFDDPKGKTISVTVGE